MMFFCQFQLYLILFLTLSSTFAQEQNNDDVKDFIAEEYGPHFSSLKIRPPDDLEIDYDFYRVRWRLNGSKSLWKVNVVHSEQVTLLDLPPGQYELNFEMLLQDKIMASSELGKCARMSKVFTLTSGEQEVDIPICSVKGSFSVSENHLFDKSPLIDPAATNSSRLAKKEVKGTEDKQDSLSLLFFGDSGTGEKSQYKVAKGMQEFCSREHCDLALLLGDNIYQKGVTSVDDKQFLRKFEIPYSGLGINFYVALGNHDTYSGSKGTQAQIEYSQKSKIWNMPARYYQFSRDDADFFAIDTNTFHVDKKQRTWLKEALSKSQANWKIVYGHHPMYSTGNHSFWDRIEGGKMKNLRSKLSPILCENGADMYITGHEHHLEVNQSKCGVVHVISGASAKTRKSYAILKRKWKRILKYARGYKLGFSHVRLYPDSAKLQILGSEGEVLYLYDFPNRK